MRGPSIELIDLWIFWWEGRDLRSMSLYGVPVIWINRVAKLVTFSAGLVVVLDIVGVERTREFFAPIATMHPRGRALGRSATLMFIIAILAAPLGAGVALSGTGPLAGNITVFFFSIAVLGLVVVTVRGLLISVLHLLQSEKGHKRIRVASLLLLVAGFAFDLFTS